MYTIIELSKPAICVHVNKFHDTMKGTTLRKLSAYLVSNFDEQRKDDDDEQIVQDANNSDDNVDDLQCDVRDVAQIQLQAFF